MTDYLEQDPGAYELPSSAAVREEYGVATCNDCFKRMHACLITDLDELTLIPEDCVHCGSQDLTFEAGEV